MIKFKEVSKWRHRALPLETRLKLYKEKKRIKESILYRYDYDMPYKGYGTDNLYKCSIILRRDMYDPYKLLWSCMDRIHGDYINLGTFWEYLFDRQFIDRVLTIPTDKNNEKWLLDAGNNIGIPISIMRETVRNMKEYCNKNDIYIRLER